ncbi:MAG TPA: hypothetical protein V6D26_27650 [Stenomitos sp.]
MNHCPCCSHQMLRHVRQRQVYWFCRSCWQEMPLLNRETLYLNSSSLFAERLISSLNRSLVSV